MSEGSPLTQAVLTAAFAAMLFVLVFAAANNEAPASLRGVLAPQPVEASQGTAP